MSNVPSTIWWEAIPPSFKVMVMNSHQLSVEEWDLLWDIQYITDVWSLHFNRVVWGAVCTRPKNEFTAIWPTSDYQFTIDSSFMQASCSRRSKLRTLLNRRLEYTFKPKKKKKKKKKIVVKENPNLSSLTNP